ncbi:MAG: transcriptional regulator [Thermocladium sp. ECH_B]|nr:MAG: transcriptional regulator [Thermocladium sp. ECH_B]
MASEEAKKLLLLVLELAGGHIETETRMQKLVFLVNQEVFHWVKFKASKYGPYSEELMKAVDKLEKEGKLVYIWDDDGVFKYFLTEKGKEDAKKLLSQLKDKDEDKLKKAMEIIQKYKDKPPTYLAAYTYKYYPEYAEKSIIKDIVERWIRYYHL